MTARLDMEDRSEFCGYCKRKLLAIGPRTRVTVRPVSNGLEAGEVEVICPRCEQRWAYRIAEAA